MPRHKKDMVESVSPDTENLIENVVRQVTKQFGDHTASTVGVFDEKPQIYLSTGNLALDWCLGTPGGLPFGRVIEIRGKFGSCKSTICAMILAQAQAAGMIGVLCDTEFTYTGDWLRKYGCDIETLIRLTPDHAQMFFDEVGLCIKSVKESKSPVPIVIICDTISNLPP